MNHFYDIWTKAVAGKNSFIPCKVQWYEVEGRDEKWLQKQIQDNRRNVLPTRVYVLDRRF